MDRQRVGRTGIYGWTGCWGTCGQMETVQKLLLQDCHDCVCSVVHLLYVTVAAQHAPSPLSHSFLVVQGTKRKLLHTKLSRQSFSHSDKKKKLKSNIAGYKYTKFTYLGKYERETLHFLNYIFNTKVLNLQALQYLKLQNSAHSCSPSKSLYIGK